MLNEKLFSIPETATPIVAFLPDIIELIRLSRESSALPNAIEDEAMRRKRNEKNLVMNVMNVFFMYAPALISYIIDFFLRFLF